MHFANEEPMLKIGINIMIPCTKRSWLRVKKLFIRLLRVEEMFEGDLADMCAEKSLLKSMGGGFQAGSDTGGEYPTWRKQFFY